MGEREAFLAALRERPDDTATALVFADWLEENGEGERAEFVRLQAREALGEADASEAARRWTDGLRGRLEVPEGVKWVLECVWCHGFLDSLSLPVQWLVEGAKTLEPDAPLLRKLTVGRVNGWGERLAAVPLLRHVRELELQAWLSPADARAIAASPHLSGLRALEIWLDNVEGGDDEALAAFAGGASSAYPHLRELRLIGVPGTWPERLAEANRLIGRDIATAPIMLPRLYPIAEDFSLWLFGGNLPDGTRALVEAPEEGGRHARLFIFSAAGEQLEVREIEVPPEFGHASGGEGSQVRSERFKDHLRNSMGFAPGLIHIRGIDDPAGNYGIEDSRWSDCIGRPDDPGVRPEEAGGSDYAMGFANDSRYWLKDGAFVFNPGGDDWFVGPDGTIDST